MKDIAARELKGHNILAVERFWDSTFWMIEFTVLRPTAYGEPGDEMVHRPERNGGILRCQFRKWRIFWG